MDRETIQPPRRGILKELRRGWTLYLTMLLTCGWLAASSLARYSGFLNRSVVLAQELEHYYNNNIVGEFCVHDAIVTADSPSTTGGFVCHVAEERESSDDKWKVTEYKRSDFTYIAGDKKYQLTNNKYSPVINANAWPITWVVGQARVIDDWDHVEKRTGPAANEPPLESFRIRGIAKNKPCVVVGILTSKSTIDPHLIHAGRFADLTERLRAARHGNTNKYFFWSIFIGLFWLSVTGIIILYRARLRS